MTKRAVEIDLSVMTKFDDPILSRSVGDTATC